jgi:hypothetical protein
MPRRPGGGGVGGPARWAAGRRGGIPVGAGLRLGRAPLHERPLELFDQHREPAGGGALLECDAFRLSRGCRSERST